MSYTRVILKHSQTTRTARLVLLALADHAAPDTGQCWPSVQTLADETGKSLRMVQYALRQAEALGELRIERNAGGDARLPAYRRPNLYTLTLECPPTCTGWPQHRVITVDNWPVTQTGVQWVAPGGVQWVAPEVPMTKSLGTGSHGPLRSSDCGNVENPF